MNPIDYSILYKRKYDTVEELPTHTYDVFLSAFNTSERVLRIFERITAPKKCWLILPEYNYSPEEYPTGQSLFTPDKGWTEADSILNFLDWVNIDYQSHTLCVDITGFIRPHLLFLVRYLATTAIKKVDFIYTDPMRYVKKENTHFSDDYVAVRQVAGCEGKHNPETTNDFLVDISAKASERNRPSVPERYAPMARITQPNRIAADNVATM